MATNLIPIDRLQAVLTANNISYPAPMLNDMAEGAFKAIQNFCGRQFTRGTYVDWPYLSGTNYVVLKERPVVSVSSVRYDNQGGWGQISGSFGSSTALTAGVDYALALDSPDGTECWSGRLLWINGVWPRNVQFTRGRLSRTDTNEQGYLKVTYVGGYETLPEDLLLAVYQFTTAVMKSIARGGPVGSEGLGAYNYALMQISPGQFQSIANLLGGYMSLANKWGIR